MAAPIWKSYAIRPIGFPGVATLVAWVVTGSSLSADAILGVRALVGPTAAAVVTDPTAVAVDVPLGVNASAYSQDLLAGPCVVSWFAQTAAGWIKGPEVVADLTSSWSAKFPYPKPWAIATLQKIAAQGVPLPTGKALAIRGAYPRDNFPLPALSIQFKAAPQGTRSLNDAGNRGDATTTETVVPWNASLDLVLWSEFPEERDALAPWFIEAMQTLSAMAPFAGLAEPAYNLSESEDFSAALMEKPLFMLSCGLTGTIWSSMALPQHNYQGHLTI